MVTKNGPWTIKGTILKYKNKWLEVHEDQVLTPNGKPSIFGTVKMKAGVSVLTLDEEGYAYLTEEFRYAIKQNSLEVVSGGVEENETPLDSAKRELEEELGIIATEWIDLGIVNPFTSAVYSPANLYLARKLKFTSRHPEETEMIRLVKVKFSEAVKMVMESKITHGPSCVLILKVKEFLNR